MSSNGHASLGGNIGAPQKSDVEPLPPPPGDASSPGTHSRPWMPPSTNVLKIAKIEGEQLQRRSLSERAGDRLVTLAGSGASAVLHLCWFAAWVLVNLDVVPGVPAFDPFPFSFLTMAVSLEAVFITIAVLNRQNRMARQADRRAHLDLQVNLLAEQESTATLRLLQRIGEHLGVPPNPPDQAALAAETDVERLATELDRKLPS